MDIRTAVRKAVPQSDKRLDGIVQRDIAGCNMRKNSCFSGSINKVSQGAARRSAMAIHTKFQRQLEGAKCLDLAHDKEVIVKKRVDYGVSGSVKRRRHIGRHGAVQLDPREAGMMISECHLTRHTVLDDTEADEPRIRLQNGAERLECHQCARPSMRPRRQ